MPACAGCHSPNGVGIPPNYPRLSGQHSEYVVAQLRAFRTEQRANDPNNVMHMIAHTHERKGNAGGIRVYFRLALNHRESEIECQIKPTGD